MEFDVHGMCGSIKVLSIEFLVGLSAHDRAPGRNQWIPAISRV
jgi:hypothetical protein